MAPRLPLRCHGEVLEGFEEICSIPVPVFGLPSWRPWKGGPILLPLVLVREVGSNDCTRDTLERGRFCAFQRGTAQS